MNQINKHHNDSHHHKGIRAKIKKILTLGHSHDHNHVHNIAENSIEGIRAVKISFIGLMITAILQIFVVYYTGSVALFADTIHNFSDALTSIPLWIAYRLSMKAKSKKYPYGYGKAEDLAGLFIIVMIGLSAVVVFWESIKRIYNPTEISHLGILALAAVIGFLGNEIVAQYRIGVGKRIGSDALIADGLHSRTDGLTSLSVLVGAIGIYYGYPIIDPIIGFIIGFMIMVIFKDTISSLWHRLMDGSNDFITKKIEDVSMEIEGITNVHNVRTRSSGRSLFAEMHITINREYTVEQSHNIMSNLQLKLHEEFNNLQDVLIHPDPCTH